MFITFIQPHVLLTFSMDGNSRICLYACDQHFQCSLALAYGRRRDGAEMINSFALIEIEWSGFVVLPLSVVTIICQD